MIRLLFITSLLASLTTLFYPAAGLAEVRDLVIVHTNDFHGHIKEEKDYAGAARFSAFVDEQRSQYPGVLLLDAGDGGPDY
jgi:2',3'-cyclic-nucleotide 2'-phosphodiesterase (5'-nucleotidase family)